MDVRAAAGLVLAWLLCFAASAATAADLETGRRVYEATCVACHGPNGRPDPDSPVTKAFDPQPADFSDPLFNSREPGQDWEMVVKHGGHALGLSPQMPPWGSSLSNDEIASVVAYLKTLTDTSDYPPGELNFMLPVRTKKAYPEDEIVWGSRWSVQDGEDTWRNVLELEKRFGQRGQAILELVGEDTGDGTELEEIEIGWKHALAWTPTSILSGAVVVAIPTESEASEEIIPYLAYGQELSPTATLQASSRVILPVDDVDLGAVELAGIVHYNWSIWPRTVFPALEVTATAPFERGEGDSVQFTVLPQLRFGLTRGGHVALNLGVELPLSDQDYDYRAHLTLLWDFADGSFFQGW